MVIWMHNKMKTLLKIEVVVFFGASIYLFNRLNIEWWWFPALILLPDISMLGYLINPRIGAYTYNFFHHKALALFVYMIGIYFSNNIILLAGIILFAHSSMDRIFGYGLKYTDSFTNTHLGIIGKKK